jgi:hypothetical protein
MMDTEPGTRVVPSGEGFSPLYFVAFQLTEGNPEVNVCLTTTELADRVGPACSREALEDLIDRLTGQLDERPLPAPDPAAAPTGG